MTNLTIDDLNFARASSATYVDANGDLQTAATNVARVGHHLWNGNEWVNAGYFHESESRTNLFLDTANPETQTISVTEGSTYTASFRAGTPVVDIDETIAATAVDVFVYDTSKDSDGGAWRTGALAQASSWYNETLNTSTRGSRREFPAVAVIVAESNKVTIYDGDDPSLPMWMVFEGTDPNTLIRNVPIKSLNAKNGEVVLGESPNGGLHRIQFLLDRGYLHFDAVRDFIFNGPIASRNSSLGKTQVNVSGIVNSDVNDCAMTVLPDAPIDPATGLPVPTIACLVAETEVTMADGSTRRLDQVQTGEIVKTLEGEHKVLNWWDQGIKDVIELEFDGGQKLICTADHKIRTTDGWVEAGDLTEEHEVISL